MRRNKPDSPLLQKLRKLNRDILKKRLRIKAYIGKERVSITEGDIADIKIAIGTSETANELLEILKLL